MNMKRFFLYFLLAALVIFNGCSEEIAPAPYTYTKFFTGDNSKTWKFKILEETLNGKVIFRTTINCATDDEYVFYAKTGHVFEVQTGSKRCSASETDIIEDVWTFNNATATLTMAFPFLADGISLPFIVREVDKNGMVLEIFLDQENTNSYRIHLDVVDED
jgi:hypothetical protein